MAKKALVVGVNQYASPGGPNLNGCVNDAQDMANTLVICGFPAAGIQVVTNQNATRANILARLQSLVNNAVSGDSIVFYFSGHGTTVTNYGPDYEVEGLDEAICPHNYYTAGVIKDDDLRSVFSGLKPGVNLEVILDSCNSGTGTRTVVVADPYSQATAIRSITPMLDDEFYMIHEREIFKKKKEEKSNKALVTVAGMNHTLWAACKDNQTSQEGPFSGVIRGYFTYHFCRALRATNGNINRNVLDTQVANALLAMGASQRNQTESTSAEFTQKVFT